MVTDGELNRALNALSATLNDQRPEGFDRERLQEIVTGAVAGNELLEVVEDPGSGGCGGWLEEDGERVAEVRLERGRWEVERRRPASHTRSYVPGSSTG